MMHVGSLESLLGQACAMRGYGDMYTRNNTPKRFQQWRAKSSPEILNQQMISYVYENKL